MSAEDLVEGEIEVQSPLPHFLYVPDVFGVLDLESQFGRALELVVATFEVDSLLLMIFSNAFDFPFEFVAKQKWKGHDYLLRPLNLLQIVAIIQELLPHAHLLVVFVGPLGSVSPIESHFVAASRKPPLLVLREFVLLESAVDVHFAIGSSIHMTSLIEILVLLLNDNYLVFPLMMYFFDLVNGIDDLRALEEFSRGGISIGPLCLEFEPFLLEVKSALFESVERRAVERPVVNGAVEIGELSSNDVVLHILALVESSILQNELAKTVCLIVLPFAREESSIGKELQPKSLSLFLIIYCFFLSQVESHEHLVLDLRHQMIHKIIKSFPLPFD